MGEMRLLLNMYRKSLFFGSLGFVFGIFFLFYSMAPALSANAEQLVSSIEQEKIGAEEAIAFFTKHPALLPLFETRLLKVALSSEHHPLLVFLSEDIQKNHPKEALKGARLEALYNPEKALSFLVSRQEEENEEEHFLSLLDKASLFKAVGNTTKEREALHEILAIISDVEHGSHKGRLPSLVHHFTRGEMTLYDYAKMRLTALGDE